MTTTDQLNAAWLDFLGSSTGTQLKAARLEVLQSSTSIANLIAELDAELARMRDRKLAAELIDKKDAQIECLINYYNKVNDLLNYYQLTTANLNQQLNESLRIMHNMASSNAEFNRIIRQQLKA
jgi:hypothetical protein